MLPDVRGIVVYMIAVGLVVQLRETIKFLDIRRFF